MDLHKIFQKDYETFLLCDPEATKYEWAAGHVFNLTTYDGYLDELFTKKIIEVCKIILERKNFDYIKDENNYLNYILVCQLLNNFNWIDWGTSLRGAWFQEQHFNQYQSQPILQHWSAEYDWQDIPFTVENLKLLFEFIEGEF